MHIYFKKSLNLCCVMKFKSIYVERFHMRCLCLMYNKHSCNGKRNVGKTSMDLIDPQLSKQEETCLTTWKSQTYKEIKVISVIKQKPYVQQEKLNSNQLFLQSISTLKHSHRHFSTSSLKHANIAIGTPEAVSSHVLTTDVTTSTFQLMFADFPTIQVAENFVHYLHDITGLPWWFTIILSAFFLRVVLMVPLTIHTQQNLSKLQHLAPEVKEKSNVLKSEVTRAMIQFGWDKNRAKKEYHKNLVRILKEMYIRDNCHPMKNVATFWVQIPVFISLSYALRNMVTRADNINMDNHMDFKSLTNEGLAWFPDLVSTDVTWILPVLVGVVTLFNLEITYLNLPAVTAYRKWLTMLLRSLSVIVIPISASVPSAVALYWVSSGFFAAFQNLLLEYSPFRRLCRLPMSPMESNSPVTNLAKKAKKKYFNK